MVRYQMRKWSGPVVGLPLLTSLFCVSCTSDPVTSDNRTQILATVASVTVDPHWLRLAVVGDTARLVATGLDSHDLLLADAAVSWSSSSPAVVTVDSEGLLRATGPGDASVRASVGAVADSALVVVGPPPTSPDSSSLTPSNLMPVLGPLVAVSSNPPVADLKTYDQRLAGSEYARFQDYLALENDPSGGYLQAEHYGGLRSRLQWAIRNGQPYGPGVTDETKYAYARGRRIVKKYLQWSRSLNPKYGAAAHSNTGLADIEALYRLEGDPDALNHIHVTAQLGTMNSFGAMTFQSQNTDPRIIAVALEAMIAAHRLGIPFGPNPASPLIDRSVGSWAGGAARQIQWLTQYNMVKSDGTVLSPAHSVAEGKPVECYFMSAMLATQLLRYYADVTPDPNVLALAKRIMDHIRASVPAGWSTLGYLSDSRGPAADLAAFYVWPSLVLWQETGDPAYKAFALKNLAASNSAYIIPLKQWNQTFSTLGEDTEALLSGVPWH